MKHSLIFIAIVLSLAACSDKSSNPVAAKNPAAPVYLKAEMARPVSLPATLGPIDTCVVDTINDQPAKESNAVADKSKIKLEGWAANIMLGSTPQDVYIELNGLSQSYIKANTGFKRPDVATAYNKPAVTNAGWIAFADLSTLGAGSYKMRVVQVTGATGLVCEAKNSIVIN